MGFADTLNNSLTPKNIATPTMAPDQQQQVQELQKLLGSSAKNSVRALSGLASNPTRTSGDMELLRDFKENVLPSFMQGAAASGAGGYSSVGGSIAHGGARLADLLEERARDRMYNANESLLEMFRSFSNLNTNTYERGDSPLASLLPIGLRALENASSERGAGYADWLGGGASLGGTIGSAVPGIGTGVGALGGAALGGLGKWIADWLSKRKPTT